MVKPYEQIYTVKEVSAILKVNVAAVNRLCNTGKLPFLKLGSRKIRGIDLEKFINTYPHEDLKEGEFYDENV